MVVNDSGLVMNYAACWLELAVTLCCSACIRESRLTLVMICYETEHCRIYVKE